jgi:hypothetical protein
MRIFLIRSVDGYMWWNYINGWTEFVGSATIYTEEESKRLPLPIEGSWVEFWEYEG